jgi:hypothetical protein
MPIDVPITNGHLTEQQHELILTSLCNREAHQQMLVTRHQLLHSKAKFDSLNRNVVVGMLNSSFRGDIPHGDIQNGINTDQPKQYISACPLRALDIHNNVQVDLYEHKAPNDYNLSISKRFTFDIPSTHKLSSSIVFSSGQDKNEDKNRTHVNAFLHTLYGALERAVTHPMFHMTISGYDTQHVGRSLLVGIADFVQNWATVAAPYDETEPWSYKSFQFSGSAVGNTDQKATIKCFYGPSHNIPAAASVTMDKSIVHKAVNETEKLALQLAVPVYDAIFHVVNGNDQLFCFNMHVQPTIPTTSRNNSTTVPNTLCMTAMSLQCTQAETSKDTSSNVHLLQTTAQVHGKHGMHSVDHLQLCLPSMQKTLSSVSKLFLMTQMAKKILSDKPSPTKELQKLLITDTNMATKATDVDEMKLCAHWKELEKHLSSKDKATLSTGIQYMNANPACMQFTCIDGKMQQAVLNQHRGINTIHCKVNMKAKVTMSPEKGTPVTIDVSKEWPLQVHTMAFKHPR